MWIDEIQMISDPEERVKLMLRIKWSLNLSSRRIGQKSLDPSPTYAIRSNADRPPFWSRKASNSSPRNQPSHESWSDVNWFLKLVRMMRWVDNTKKNEKKSEEKKENRKKWKENSKPLHMLGLQPTWQVCGRGWSEAIRRWRSSKPDDVNLAGLVMICLKRFKSSWWCWRTSWMKVLFELDKIKIVVSIWFWSDARVWIARFMAGC